MLGVPLGEMALLIVAVMVAGVATGILAGLFGIGGGAIIVPVLYEDRATVRAIHALKVEKYAVARGAAAIGLYPREARDTTVSLRLDPCPGG